MYAVLYSLDPSVPGSLYLHPWLWTRLRTNLLDWSLVLCLGMISSLCPCISVNQMKSSLLFEVLLGTWGCVFYVLNVHSDKWSVNNKVGRYYYHLLLTGWVCLLYVCLELLINLEEEKRVDNKLLSKILAIAHQTWSTIFACCCNSAANHQFSTKPIWSLLQSAYGIGRQVYPTAT